MWRIVLTVSLLCWSADGQVTCRNHSGGAVDWYIMYKAPKLKNIGTKGLEYLYIDSDGKMETSKNHNKLINNTDGVLGHTLKPLFEPTTSMPEDFGFITYSDQAPGCNAADTFGHSKGLVMMNKTSTGVWLLHSLPQFPFLRDQNRFYPSSGEKYAQTFICVTFKYAEFKKIGEHLLNIAAFPFDHNIPADFHKELIDVTERTTAPQGRVQDLKSAAGVSFRSIAKTKYKPKPTGGGRSKGQTTKSPPTAKGPSAAKQKKLSDPNRFEGDLYLTIAKEYKTDVRVQTWGCQRDRDGSYCEKNQRHVININEVKANLGGGEVRWNTTKDHSKWCISGEKSKIDDLICIADVNRGLTQYERPGGALCFIHKEASLLFKGVIADLDNCPSSSSGAGSKRPRSPDTDCVPDCDPDCDPDCGDDDPDCTDKA
ncbi:deoxyribonuclease-2-beta isoform X2 [Etheostoma spectabile]|uniref:deoxyribonuclease-2-beta isoform X2 n=1 Tax=Etheostoma spectabile TaxID=54343 RepID=UPI0013AEC104|nr:deoxyribonuclease-2-beta-like isoform X2 [Etheostoma spectabile]